MGVFSRQEHNPVMALTSQELVIVQTAMLRLLPQCGQLALIAVALHFADAIPHQACQESAVALCQQLRQSVRGSDHVYLYENGTEHYHYGLFFILPEADLNGGSIVQARLETAFLSVLPQLTAQPRSVMHRYASLGQVPILVEGPTYTDLNVNQKGCCIQLLPTQPSSMFSLHAEGTSLQAAHIRDPQMGI